MSDYISSDLIDEIFIRLPAKSILRFRLVSKSLCARISDPDFIRKHTLLSPPKYLIGHRIPLEDKDYYTIHSEFQLPLYYSGGYDDKTAFKFPYNDNFKIVGSCNGIFCVHKKYGGDFSLWNPSIRLIRKLQKLPDDIPFWYPTLDQNVIAGFGFDSVNDDYKIMWLSYSRTGKSPVCSFVYSMKTDAWCKIQVPSTPFSQVSSYACLFNGALHWIADCDLSMVDHIDRRYILKFDLSTHLFGNIVLPKPNCRNNRLAIIKGSLAVFSTTFKESSIFLREEHDCTSS